MHARPGSCAAKSLPCGHPRVGADAAPGWAGTPRAGPRLTASFSPLPSMEAGGSGRLRPDVPAIPSLPTRIGCGATLDSRGGESESCPNPTRPLGALAGGPGAVRLGGARLRPRLLRVHLVPRLLRPGVLVVLAPAALAPAGPASRSAGGGSPAGATAAAAGM